MALLKVKCNYEGILTAANIIENEGVVIFPTDTVYGMGCNPYSKNAVKKIYNIKARDTTKLLPILLYSRNIAMEIAQFDKYSYTLAEKFWPGPLTLVLELKDKRLTESLNLKDKVAIRIPNNKCTLELLKRCKLITGTSANVSGQKPFTDPISCYQNISGFDVFLDGGEISGGVPSTIVEIINGEINIQREGSITKEEIMKVF